MNMKKYINGGVCFSQTSEIAKKVSGYFYDMPFTLNKNKNATCNNVHFSAISSLRCRFREFGSASNQQPKRRPIVTMPAQDLHVWLLHHLRYQLMGVLRIISVIKPFCAERLILIGWALCPSEWVYLPRG
jgi:hypothetical protein